MSEEERFTLYRTSDIYFAAYLCSLDISLETTETEEGGGNKNRKVMFIFKVPVKDMQRLKASFFGGSGTVKAQKFVQHLRSLKSMCFV